MNLFYKYKGSVTIFLVLILVPVIAVCTIFVDASRVKLAQGVVYSSGDLALNTVLTQYDPDLADYYGLMASCQSVEEFYDVAENYFAACMVSQGVAATDAQYWAKSLKSIFIDNENISDFIGIEALTTGADISEVEDANLANAAMLKNQVMDFMKYRAPIELIGEVAEAMKKKKGFLGKLESVQKKIEAMPAETTVKNNKTKYYLAENELLDEALQIFEILKKYENMDLDTSDMNKRKENMGKIADKYKELHKKYVTYWCNTKNAKAFESVGTKLSKVSASVSGTVYKQGLKDYISACETAVTTYNTCLQKVNEKLATISYSDFSKIDEVNKAQYYIQMSTDLGTEYDSYVTAVVDLKQKYENMKKAYENRDKGQRPTGNKIPKKDENGNIVYEKDGKSPVMVDEMEDYDIKDEDGIEDSYNNAISNAQGPINSISSQTVYKISSKVEEFYKATIGEMDRINATNEIYAVITDLNLITDYDELVTAQGYLKQMIDKLDNLVKLADDCKAAFDTWDESVEKNKDKDSESIKEDREEIQKLKGEGEHEEGDYTPASIEIDGEKVKEFKQRLQNIYDLMDSYRKTLESIQYRGTTIFGKKVDNKVYTGDNGINNLDSTFDNAAKGSKNGCTAPAVKASDIPVYQTDLDKYITDTFQMLDKMSELTGLSVTNMPELHEYKAFGPIDSSSIEPLEFDAWLHEKFDIENRKESEAIKGLLDTLKQMVKALKDGIGGDKYKAYNNDNYVCRDHHNISDIEDTPSKLHKASFKTDKEFSNENKDAEEQVEESIKVGGLFDCFDFANLLTNGRDNLYAITYIMNMFTYETYHLEYMYESARKKESECDKVTKNIYHMCLPNEITRQPGNMNKVYDDDSIIGNENSGWLNESPTFIYNKSLTNKMIGKTHNDDETKDNEKLSWSYGNEVEYILYGGNNDSNKEKINTTIFFIRYALNLGPVMTYYYTYDVITDIAAAVSSATMGVIPEPLVKVILCLGICAAESVVDMNYLKSGLPVAFFKVHNDETNQLFIKLKIQKGKDFGNKFVQEKKLDPEEMFKINDVTIPEDAIYFSYSDYLQLFLFIELCAVEDNVYYRMGDVIQANMQNNTEADYGEKVFKLLDARTYFQIKADTIKVKPIMLKLPYAQMYDSVKDVANTDTWNTFSYKAVRGY